MLRASFVWHLVVAMTLVACGSSGSDEGGGPDGSVGDGSVGDVLAEGSESGDGPAPEGSVSQAVDSSGATLSYEGVTLTVPPGALDDSQVITIWRASDPAPSGLTPLSPIYHFGPDGLKFRLPITVTIAYEGGADDVVIYWSDGSGGWDQSGMIGIEADAAVTTEEMHFSSGFVSHLSKYRSTNCDNDDAAKAFRTACSGAPGDVCLDNVPQFPIQYVFVLMMENHSFDNYFGRFQAYLRAKGYADARTADGGLEVPATPYDALDASGKATEDAKLAICTYDPKKDAPWNPPRAGNSAKGACEKHYWQHANGDGEQCVADTCHEWWCSHLQVDNGKMDGFFYSNDGFWEGGEPNVGYGPYATIPMSIPSDWYDTTKHPNAPSDGTLLRGDRAMLYYDERDVPFYYWIADEFGIADHYHCSVIGPTFVNRDYLYGATSRGLTSNASNDYGASAITGSPFLYAAKQTPNPAVLKYNYTFSSKAINSIYDDLEVRDVKYTQWVRNRYSNVAAVPKCGAWFGNLSCQSSSTKYTYDKQSFGGDGFEHYVQLENAALLAQLAKGKKPISLKSQGHIFPVNFIDPNSLEDVNGEDEHPPSTPQMGQKLTYDVIRVLTSNPEVWKRSVLFITWDEHGGFYDHVPPPAACAPDLLGPSFSGAYGGGPHTPYSDAKESVPRQGLVVADNNDTLYSGGFDQLGVRVPLLVISPWVKHQYVSHNVYDHTSILRFIEYRFGMPALTKRDANADPMLDMFDFSNAPSKLFGTALADKGCFACSGGAWGTETLPSDGAYADAASLGNNTSGDAVRYYQTANATCVSLFPPVSASGATYPKVLNPDLCSSCYGAYDFSRGHAPPPGLSCGGGGGGCCTATPCPLDYRWCASDCKCELALVCPPGDFILGGCDCCAAFDSLDPLTCISCDSKSDVFSTYCPGG